ncbi:MAG: GNAT family N-acetyltransferase [Marinilabiliales bacterium]|nr:MAG: GNAT family N-acetyltransferase [Marinilabiliales bacterium]
MEKTWKILESESIKLRKPEPEDLEFLYTLENNPDYWFVSDSKSPYSKWQLKLHIENSIYDIYANKEIRLIIEEKETNKSIGIIDLFEFEPFHSRIGLGILILEEFRNKGIADKSIKLATDYCFKVLEINQIWCNIDSENLVSIKLFENAGFKKSGVLSQWKLQNGEFQDVLFYQILKNEN